MNRSGGIKQVFLGIVILVLIGMISGNTMAQTTRTWDGGGSANNSGSWQTNANWSGDTKPASGEIGALGDVTSGTRTVTNEAAVTIVNLSMTQNSVAGTNKLLLNANMTLTGLGNNSWVQTLGTAVDNMVVNLNGKTLLATLNGYKNETCRGTWDLSTPGSAISSINTMTLTGRLVMGSNTTITISRVDPFVILDNYGTVTFQGNGIATIGDDNIAAVGPFNNKAAATFTVGNGTDTPTARLRQGNVYLVNASGGTITVNAGAILALYPNAMPPADLTWGSHKTTVDNYGTFNLTGKLLFRPNSWNLEFDGDKDDIDNFGVWNVTGASAVLERQHVAGSQVSYFRFANNAAGTVQGNGKLTYTNKTGQSSLDWCYLSSAGTIAPTAGGSLTLQGMIVTNTGAITLNNSALTMANGSLNNIGGTVSIQNGGLLEANTFTQPSGTMTNSGGIYQFSAANPTVTRTTADTIVLTNGIISFRAVTNADVFANWPGGNRLTNILYQGANAFRLDSASNTVAKSQSYTFAANLGATNYTRLELINGAMYRGGTATFGSGGALVVSNGTSTISSNLTFQPGSTFAVHMTTNATSGSVAVGGTTIALGGATLQVTLGAVPVVGQYYPILFLPGTAPVAGLGTFSSGTVAAVYAGQTYTLSVHYGAGDGNDVTATLARPGTVISIH